MTLHNVDPATRFDLIDDDADEVIVGFDFAEFQHDSLTLWVIPPDDSGAEQVAVVYSVTDHPYDESTVVDLLDRTFATRRVSVMAPFGAKRMSQDTITARSEKYAIEYPS